MYTDSTPPPPYISTPPYNSQCLFKYLFAFFLILSALFTLFLPLCYCFYLICLCSGIQCNSFSPPPPPLSYIISSLFSFYLFAFLHVSFSFTFSSTFHFFPHLSFSLVQSFFLSHSLSLSLHLISNTNITRKHTQIIRQPDFSSQKN